MHNFLNALYVTAIIMFVTNNALGWNLEWLDLLSCVVFVVSYSASYILHDHYVDKLNTCRNENNNLKTKMLDLERRVNNLENK